MPAQEPSRQSRPIRIHNHRSAVCPWCRRPVIRSEMLVDGELEKVVACLSDACGWLAVVGVASVVEEANAKKSWNES